MDFCIIIPAHNEQDYIGKTLQSVVDQSLPPKKLLVVNDNSTDNTQTVVEDFVRKYEWISLLNIHSSVKHIPGSKVIQAFYKGFNTIHTPYDIICKFDADIILPKHYLQTLATIFKQHPKAGIVGGHAYIKKNNVWIYENVANKSHVRGPFKAYRKACFNAIGGLRKSIGWDTVDTLLAKYYGWEVITDASLHVKHLKPTGHTYNKASKYLQGEALYKMRYGFVITCITAAKIAYRKRSLTVFKHYILGYFKAKKKHSHFLVTPEEGRFIRHLRWKGIINKLNIFPT